MMTEERAWPGNPLQVLSGFFSSYAELTKLRLVSLVLMSAAAGYFLAPDFPNKWESFLHVLFATGLVAAGSQTLNQWLERDYDALMPRTARRPIPTGRVKPSHALIAGIFLSVIGLFFLWKTSNTLTVILGAVTLASYLIFYTPLKRITSLNSIAGAVPGAIPPMMGWTAVTGRLDFEAWVLFAILFLWQMPHFLAIAWLYREEYYIAGFVMLSGDGFNSGMVARQAVLYAAMLLPVSLVPTLCGMSGKIYFFSALALGIFLLRASAACLSGMDNKARPLLRASILYLSLLLLIMAVDKV